MNAHHAITIVALLGCGCAKSPEGNRGGTTSSANAQTAPPPSAARASDGKLEIWISADDHLNPHTQRPELRVWKIHLHVHNLDSMPVRVLMPTEPNRGPDSSLYFYAETSGLGGAYPEWPRHGPHYTEADFYLLQPNEERAFEQPVLVEALGAAGTPPSRDPRFPAGQRFEVSWRYAIAGNTFAGGVGTIQPSTALFGGEPVRDLWTGSLQTPRVGLVAP